MISREIIYAEFFLLLHGVVLFLTSKELYSATNGSLSVLRHGFKTSFQITHVQSPMNR